MNAHGTLFDSRGRIVTTRPHKNAVRSASNRSLYGWRRMCLRDIHASGDPASRLTGAVTDGGEGSGLSFPLTASWQSQDAPGNYPYLTWPLLDLHGFPVGGDLITFQLDIIVALRGTWSETDDIIIGLALSTESAFTGSTIESKGVHIIANGAGGSGVIGTGNSTCTNGAGTQTNAAAGAAGVIYASGAVGVFGGGTGRLACAGTIGLDSSGNVVASSGSAGATTVTLASPPSQWFIHVYAGRVDNTNASTKTVTADCYYAPPLIRGLPV